MCSVSPNRLAAAVVARILALCLVVAAAPALAASPSIEVASATTDDAVSVERVARPAFEAHFATLPAPALRVATASGEHAWLRLRSELPGSTSAWVLAFDRAAADRMEAWLLQPGARPLALGSDGFHRPAAAGLALRSDYAFELPKDLSGPVELYVAVKSGSRVQLEPRWVEAADREARDRGTALRSVALYAALLLLAAVHLTLFAALGDRRFLAGAGFAAAVAGWLAIASGHLHQLPGTALAGWLGAHALFMATLLAGAAALHLQQRLLAFEQQPPLARAADGLRYLMLALAALALFRLGAPPLVQVLGSVAFMLVLLWLVATAALRSRAGEPLAAPVGLLWLVFALAATPVLLANAGWITPGSVVRDVAPLALAATVLLFALVLVAGVREFRERHDRVAELHQQTGADLEIEQRRRQFSDALRESMRNAGAPGDLEWRAFKQLSQTLAGLLPHRAIAISATGYRGFDFLLTEPMGAKARYCNLLAARASTLKGICRSRSPVQLKLELGGGDDVAAQPAEPALFAIVPLQVARPGWGALLIERDADAGFEPRELALAAEFVALTLAAADDAAARADLHRTADVDPLTGVLNARAGAARLELLLRQASVDRGALALLAVDLDHFRQVNERHGEAIGDECLRGLVEAIRPQLGPDDIVMRHGGEEFLAALPDRSVEEARQIAERIRAQVAMLRIEADGALIKLTVSIGVAARVPGDERIQPLIERAMRALGQAKRAGRNQVQLGSAHGGQGEAAGIPPVY